MNIEIALKEANIILKKNNIKSYQLDSEILMSDVSKLSRKDFILNKDIELRCWVWLYNIVYSSRKKKIQRYRY